MPFDYYHRLSKRDQAIYRKSDRLQRLRVPAADELGHAVEGIRAALSEDDRGAVQRQARALVRGLMEQLEVEPVEVRVLSCRPSNASGELHGLYEAEEGCVPVIRVWMRTAAKRRPVRHRTFVRTLLHEVCHHLDYALYELADSFHTEGFFKRESALARALLPADAPEPAAEAPAPKRTRKKPKKAAPPKKQLDLF